jgi:phosphoribosylanthranilate isomerase
VKICGVTTAEDAECCIAAKADAIGFNLWPRSRRYRPLDEIAAIARPLAGRVERFGVFVDPRPEDVEAAFAAGAIDVAQLHGDEDRALCDRFAGRHVKALRLAGEHSLADLERYDCDRFLVDAPFAGYGGSGLLVDTRLAKLAIARARVILAGGLTPDNVAELIATTSPWGVDVASGVELRPGVKDHDKVRAFVAHAKGAHVDG